VSRSLQRTSSPTLPLLSCLLFHLWLRLGSDAENDFRDLGHLLSCESKGRVWRLEVSHDFCGSVKGHCADLLIAFRVVVDETACAVFLDVDVQIALCCEPYPVTNEAQSVVSDVACESGTRLDELTILSVEGILRVDEGERFSADLTIDASDRGLVVSSKISCYQKAMTTVVDGVGVDTLADFNRQRQETEECGWNADRDEAGLRSELLPGREWSSFGLGEHRERTGDSSLDWSRIGCARLAGNEPAVRVMVVKVIVAE